MTFYDVPNLNPGGSAMGFPQYGQLGLLAPAQQGYNPLLARQPSVLDRVLGRLFPTAQYTGLLDPGTQRDVQRQGLVGLGTSLLQAGGPQAVQRGTLANLGGALQQSQMGFPQMAEQALQLQAYRSQVAQQQAVQKAVAGASDDPVAMIHKLLPLYAGNPKAIEALGAAAKSLGGEGESITKIEHVTDTQLGSPTIGMTGTITLQGGKRIRFDPESAQGKYHIEKNTETGAAYYVPDTPAGGKPVAVGLNLGGRTSSSQAALTGAESRAAAGRLLSAQVTGSQVEEAHHANAVPSTIAAIVGGVTKKIAGEEAGAGVKQALRGSLTNQYQAAAGRWVDAYMQLVPKSRSGSAELRELVLRTYWGQEGDDMANVTAKAQARKAATASLARAVATGTAPALPGFEPEPSAP